MKFYKRKIAILTMQTSFQQFIDLLHNILTFLLFSFHPYIISRHPGCNNDRGGGPTEKSLPAS